MNNIKMPELLSPAGGMQQLKAAVLNGADAVYMGGPLFNARIKAENFNKESFREAICYAHERNVKIYVTLNTLIRDDELAKAFSYVDFLYGSGADALIIQDMGVARLVKKYFPDFPMHLSTQGTVYNRWGAALAKELGFCRIVPARELSLEEIRTLAAECHSGEQPCEVEVFVHGALCMCYSGQCHMSRVLGGENGRSGNRGLCAQPCRLPYRDDKGRNEYLLSPKDICQLSHIPELCEAGVDSFKIEGRLKSPHYVAIVTSIYRKYLDMYASDGYVDVEEEDMKRLMQIFNRGGFTNGYLFGNPGKKLLSGKSPKNTGIYAGKVNAVKRGSTLIDIAPKEDIEIGDGVEIIGRKVNGNVISYRKELPGGLLRIGDLKGESSVGDAVYKVTDKALMAEAERSYENGKDTQIPVYMNFRCYVGEKAELEIGEADNEISVRVSGEKEAEQAHSRPVDADRIKQQLSKLGDTPFAAERINIELSENVSIPVSEINRLRRNAVNALRTEKCKTVRKSYRSEEIENICSSEKLGVLQLEDRYVGGTGDLRKEEILYVMTREDLKRLNSDNRIRRVYVPLELYMMDECEIRNDIEVIPYIFNISKGNADRYIEKNFEKIADKTRQSGIMTGNLGWIKQFTDAGVKVYGDYGLNVYNMQSRKLFEELGVETVFPSLETGMYFFENIPLMVTEHEINSEFILDRKVKKHTILRWYSGDKYLILKK